MSLSLESCFCKASTLCWVSGGTLNVYGCMCVHGYQSFCVCTCAWWGCVCVHVCMYSMCVCCVCAMSHSTEVHHIMCLSQCRVVPHGRYPRLQGNTSLYVMRMPSSSPLAQRIPSMRWKLRYGQNLCVHTCTYTQACVPNE